MTTPICWWNCSHNSMALWIWMWQSQTSHCTYGAYYVWLGRMLILLFKVWFEKAVNASKLCLKSFKCFEAYDQLVRTSPRFGQPWASAYQLIMTHLSSHSGLYKLWSFVVVIPHKYVRHDSLNFTTHDVTSTWQKSRSKLLNISPPFGWCSKELFTWN